MDGPLRRAILLGVALPPVIAVVEQPGWDCRARRLVAVLLSFAIGATPARPTDRTVSGILTALVATVSYDALWQPSGVAGAIEQATVINQISGNQYNAGAEQYIGNRNVNVNNPERDVSLP